MRRRKRDTVTHSAGTTIWRSPPGARTPPPPRFHVGPAVRTTTTRFNCQVGTSSLQRGELLTPLTHSTIPYPRDPLPMCRCTGPAARSYRSTTAAEGQASKRRCASQDHPAGTSQQQQQQHPESAKAAQSPLLLRLLLLKEGRAGAPALLRPPPPPPPLLLLLLKMMILTRKWQ